MISRKKIIAGWVILLALVPVLNIAQQADSVEVIDSLVNVLVRERRNWNDASEKLIEFGKPAVDPLIEVLTDQSLPEWPRRKAAFTLRDIPSERIVGPCIHIFQDTLEPVALRIDACRTLKGKDVSQYSHIFMEASNHENPFIRLVAMQRLWALGGDPAKIVSMRGIKDEHNLVRRSAYEYITRLPDYSVNQLLIQGLFDEDWYVREYIFNELKAGNREVSGYLEDIILNPANDESIRWSAISILRQAEYYQNVHLFIKMLHDPSWMIRNETVLALSRRSEFIKWEDLIGEFEALKPDIQYSIYLLIGRLGPEASISWLTDKLNDPENGWMAAMALGLSRTGESIGPLTEGLKDPDTKKRQACLWALTQIHPENLLEIITPSLSDNDPEVVRLAINALKKIGSSEAESVLLKLQ